MTWDVKNSIVVNENSHISRHADPLSLLQLKLSMNYFQLNTHKIWMFFKIQSQKYISEVIVFSTCDNLKTFPKLQGIFKIIRSLCLLTISRFVTQINQGNLWTIKTFETYMDLVDLSDHTNQWNENHITVVDAGISTAGALTLDTIHYVVSNFLKNVIARTRWIRHCIVSWT